MQRLAAGGVRAAQSLGHRPHRAGVVAALEVEEDEVVERVHRQLLAAFARVDGRLRRLAALPSRPGIFVRRVDAEGRLALRPQIEDRVLVRLRRADAPRRRKSPRAASQSVPSSSPRSSSQARRGYHLRRLVRSVRLQPDPTWRDPFAEDSCAPCPSPSSSRSLPLAAPGPMRAQAPAPADLVLVNGTVLTVDATDSVAQAVAIAGGKIVAVGSNDAIRARVGPSTQVIDLRGRTATPGLIDTHVHFSEVDALFAVELSDARVDRRRAREGARAGRQGEAGRMGARPRLGRRQVRGAPLRHRRGSRQGRAEQSGVADADDRPLRRRQQLRAEDVGGYRRDDRRRRPARSTATRTTTRPA